MLRWNRSAPIAVGAIVSVAVALPIVRAWSRDHPRVEVGLSLDAISNGIAITRDHRTFLSIVGGDGRAHPQAAERVAGKLVPYPDANWNSWRRGEPADAKFVHVNALRIGPTGDLWIVDAGATGFGATRVPGGPKLVRIDPLANQVRRVYRLDAATTERSYVDDVRFHGNHAYLTDAGDPALIVLDLETGDGRRVLKRDPSTTAARPITADGRTLRGRDGRPIYIHADQLEVSPDGAWLDYQPCSGPLSRIGTQWLDDPTLSDAERAEHVERVAETSTTGGTAIDAHGTLYLGDADHRRVVRLTPDGTLTTLVEDPRLDWVDAMWIDAAGDLWMPAAQLDRTPDFNGGVSRVALPMHVYKVHIGVPPPPGDHP